MLQNTWNGFKQPLKRLEKAFKCHEGLCWLWGNHRESLGEGGTDPEELWGTGASPPAASAPPLCPRVSTIRHTERETAFQARNICHIKPFSSENKYFLAMLQLRGPSAALPTVTSSKRNTTQPFPTECQPNRQRFP